MMNYEQQDSPVETYLGKLTTNGSRRAMRHELDSIAKFLSDGQCNADTLEWHRLRLSHVIKARNWLAKTFKHSTANKALCALRGVLKCAWRLKMMSADDYFAAIDFQQVRGKTDRAGRLLSDEEITKILKACQDDTSKRGRRDYALIALLYATGARRSEITQLQVSDYYVDDSYILIRKGKSGKERRVHISPTICKAINAWLEVYPQTGDAPLFVPILKNDALTNAQITDQGIYLTLQTRAKQAGLEDVKPHDLRRTFISSLIDKGVDLATIAKMAGHDDINETARYDRRKEEPSRRAAELMTI